ncbi:GHKL domain-containing protein [Paenibacillus lycopersici]|uniref:GHKL domain-containing protein n=1 Tax=Paenibacillus lycopersici TaxID=2704462 RepID=A0A6C0G6M5_9BACL|nr:ATP-binding protein [Paenibacillus lycopersici]QHT61415.1 GHKL domain-containing protein [Paenibacillus lycopersici]
MGLMNMLFGRMLDRRISAFQHDLILKHCDEVQHMYNQMRGWRHDYHNHIQTMKAHLALGQTAALDDYLNQLDSDLSAVDTVLQTGNVMVDAILNSKLSLIATKSIAVNAKAVVPDKLRVSEIDLCVMIGNLLDNAMEACLKQALPSNRFIRVYIGILKQQLYISVANSVGGDVIRSGKSFLTTKDSDTHGFGLMRIDRIADKYNGYVNRQHEEGVFATEIMLPL